MVPIQLKNLTPVGTAIKNVMNEKKGSSTAPVANMWCAHTVIDSPAMAMMASTRILWASRTIWWVKPHSLSYQAITLPRVPSTTWVSSAPRARPVRHTRRAAQALQGRCPSIVLRLVQQLPGLGEFDATAPARANAAYRLKDVVAAPAGTSEGASE
jgi:hypothetical protein